MFPRPLPASGEPSQCHNRSRTVLIYNARFMSKLTHFNAAGEAHMVDVGTKPATGRRAVAEGTIRMQPATFTLIESGGHKKGDVLGIARVAGSWRPSVPPN